MEFNKEAHKVNNPSKGEGRFADTHQWADHGIESAKILTENVLVKEIATHTTEKGPASVEKVSVHLCYNWKSKIEFILVRSILEETFSYYTPQYGRDDNYDTHTRRDYEFLAFSVEAFRREKPELARCLETI
jgi:hypothetical protein